MTRIIDDEDTVAGGVVRRYLEQQPELAVRLTAAGEGGALLLQPSGEVGSREALFDEAIGAMMLVQR